MKRLASLLALLVAACGAPPAPDSASSPPASAVASVPAPREAPAESASSAPAASASAVPARAAPAVSAAAARAAAEGVWKELVKEYAKPALEGPGEAPICDAQGCAWKVSVTVMGRSERASIGDLWVDAASKQVVWQPNDGVGKKWKIDEFLASRKNDEAIVKAVEALPEVKAFCARVQAQKLGCLLYISEPRPEKPCPKQPAPGDECLVSVYVGEAHETHSSRFATVMVDPGSRAIVAVGDMMCDSLTLARWRARLRKRPPPDDCN